MQFKLRKTSLMAFACAVILGGCQTTQVNPGAQKAQGDLSVLTSGQSLAVPYFKVNFLKFYSDTATAGDGFFDRGPSTGVKMEVKLKGLSDDIFQKITDEAYDDLNAKIASSKYKLIPKDKVLASPQYKNIESRYPDVDDKNAIHIPTGTRFPDGFTVGLRYGEVIQDLRAPTLLVNYTVNFVNFDKDTQHRAGWNTVTNRAEISAAPLVQVAGTAQVVSYNDVETCNRMSQACMGAASQLTLSNKHTSTTLIGEMTETTDTAASVIISTVNLLARMQGTSTRDYSEYTLTAQEQAYYRAVLDAIKSANSELVSQLP